MKRSLMSFSLLAVCLLAALPATARQGEPPQSLTESHLKAQIVDTLWLDAIDAGALLAEDAARFEKSLVDQAPQPVRYALPVDLKVTPRDHGTWTELADGRLWRLEVRAPGATDLNFGFTRFRIPKGAELYVISPEDGYYQGPYTGADVRDHGQLWTPVIPGEVGLIELFVPHGVKVMPQLELGRVGRGYRDLFNQGISAALKQGSCNIDVVCPERAGWEDQIRSVGVYGTGGSTFCTGTLINNLAEDERPFFLTANHCGISSSNAASVVVYWNYESPTCGALSGGSLSDNTSGATFRASDSQNDMTLIELNSTPDASYDVYYSGWDARTSTAPQSSVGIHHPNTDEKAISFNDDPLTTVNSCIGGGGSNTHWEVDNWEQGTTEPGSSGSALFDPATKRLVGYLSGGTASCTNTSGYDCYGKISVGWSRGLSTWLDPSSTGVRFVDGLESTGGGGGGGGPTVLANGVPVTGLSGATGSQQFFTLEVPAGATNLNFQMSGGSGDADLYVKYGSAPTTSSYDCRPYSSGNNESCPISSAVAGTYHVMIRAYSTFSGVSLVGSFDTGGGGGGDTGQTWTNLSGSTGNQQFFTQTITTSSKLTVSISGGSGDADLYVRFGSAPTTSTWDCRPYRWGNNETCTFDPASSGTYHIMVRAYSTYSGVTLTTTPE